MAQQPTRLQPAGAPDRANPARQADIGKLTAAIDDLNALIEQETVLVRAGRLGEAAQIEPQKAAATQIFLATAEALKSNPAPLKALPAAERAALRQRQDQLRARLDANLIVLATAHAVAEGIIRGAAAGVARNSAPKTYGLSGRPVGAGAAQPVALSRTL